MDTSVFKFSKHFYSIVRKLIHILYKEIFYSQPETLLFKFYIFNNGLISWIGWLFWKFVIVSVKNMDQYFRNLTPNDQFSIGYLLPIDISLVILHLQDFNT